MEQNSENQVQTPQPQTTSQTIEKPTKSNNIPVIIMVVVTFLSLSFSGLLYYQNMQLKKVISETKIVENQNATPTPKTTANSLAAEIPTDWTIEKNTTCNVNIPLPPKVEPYFIPDNPDTPPAVDDEGGYWRVQDNPNFSQDMFNNHVVAVFGNPDAPGSGYVAGLVQVRCAKNDSNYDSKTLLTSYENNFTNGTYIGLSLEKKGSTEMWGKTVEKISIVGGMYPEGKEEYLFATDSTIYLIDKSSMSQSKFIQETTDKIFNNLTFNN